MVPAVFRAAQQLALEKNVPLRRLWPGNGTTVFKRKLMQAVVASLTRMNESRASQSRSVNMELVSIFTSGQKPAVLAYRSLLEKCRSDVVELMVHPANVDAVHRESTAISEISLQDYEILSSREWLNYLENCGFELVSYRGIT
jgi:predicted glycoside hydrolase/deacetylase ChbG (UPF0249 family)